jgi:flagellar L-ring protein precursor FlgH
MKNIEHGVKMFGLLAVLMISGCSSTKSLSTPPALPDNWSTARTYSNTTPITRPRPEISRTKHAEATSLWSSSPKSLFGDRRASQYGDILTVVIEIDDEAEISNSVANSRQADQGFSIGALFGLPELVTPALPGAANLTPAVDLSRGSSINGNGNIKRQEKMTLRLAARVIDVMPNGYLSLAGRQEIMVNNEVRYLQVTGLIRTQDISRLNTITYDKIAEARVFYGGQGQVTDSVRPRSGNKVFSKLLPF